MALTFFGQPAPAGPTLAQQQGITPPPTTQDQFATLLNSVAALINGTPAPPLQTSTAGPGIATQASQLDLTPWLIGAVVLGIGVVAWRRYKRR